MARNTIINSGDRYGLLTIIKEVEKKPRSNGVGVRRYFQCKCDCGNTGIFPMTSMRSGCTTSCGCHQKKRASEVGRAKRIYRHRKLYNVHNAMISRCHNKEDAAFHNYGGRGITVCDEWRSKPDGAHAFIKWALENGYSEGLDLDRRKNNLGYSPSNCRFVTRKVNCYNKRDNIKVFFEGTRYTLSSFHSKYKLDIPLKLLRERLYKGETLKSAMERPVNSRSAAYRSL